MSGAGVSGPRPMHAERTDDPEVVRWVVHHPTLSDAPSGVRRADDDTGFGQLVAGGAIVEVAVDDGDVLVRAADHNRWRDLAPSVQAALEEALGQLDHPGTAAHWLLEASEAEAQPGPPSVADVQRVIDRAAGAVLGAHGGSMTVVSVEPPVVRLRAGGACHRCAQADATLLDRVEPAIAKTYPTLVELILEDGEAEPRELLAFPSRRRTARAG